MSKNIIFCFSGTGNSLHVARLVSEQYADAVLVPMTGKTFEIDKDAETIGFVYPTYFGGIPLQVRNYIGKLSIPTDAYTYAIATFGGMSANGIRDLHVLLKQKSRHDLNYGETLKMPSNYIVMYPMETDKVKISNKNELAETGLKAILEDILKRKTNSVKDSNWLIPKYTGIASRKSREKDKDFTVADSCTSCKRCKEICPVKNITMGKCKLSFLGKCEQCMACIQTCPVKAINYKNKTQLGDRYFHPAVKIQELIRFNHENDK